MAIATATDSRKESFMTVHGSTRETLRPDPTRGDNGVRRGKDAGSGPSG